jgi:hypothetical protein
VDPIVLYIGIVAGAFLILALASRLTPATTRACPRCGDDVDVRSRHCRRCSYRF